MPFSRNMPSRWGEDTDDPFLQMRREMNRLFDDVFGRPGSPTLFGPTLRQMPTAVKIDLSETENEIQVTAEMPGIDPNEVEVLLEDDRLIIRGENKEEREERDRNYHIRERVQGTFSRTLTLPFEPNPSKVSAEFKNGLMTITIPKPQEVKPKQHRIEVQRDVSAPSVPSVSAQAPDTERRREQREREKQEQQEREQRERERREKSEL
jgi:HSP20 family protein